MNRKQFGILLVLLIVLGGAGWLVRQNHQRAADAGEQGAGRKVMGDAFPLNDITRISVKQGASMVNIAKTNDIWCVLERGNYPADYGSLSEFLLKLRDLKAVQSEQVGASQWDRLQLSPGTGSNSATVVALFGTGEKLIDTLRLGKMHLRKPTAQQQQMGMGGEGFPDGRYIVAGKDTNSVLLISEPFNNIEAKPQSWLDKSLFKVERPKAISVTFPAATNSWKLERDTDSGEWKLADAKADEKLDAARAQGVSTPFASPTLDDVELPGVKPEDIGMDKPTVITIATFDDFIYTVKIGAKTNENYPITMAVVSDTPATRVVGKDEKPEDKDKADKAWAQRQKDLAEKLKQQKRFENWTYLLASWNVDPILKDRKDLLEEKKEEPKPTPTPDTAPTGTNAVETPKPTDPSPMPPK